MHDHWLRTPRKVSCSDIFEPGVAAKPQTSPLANKNWAWAFLGQLLDALREIDRLSDRGVFAAHLLASLAIDESRPKTANQRRAGVNPDADMQRHLIFT